MIDPEILSKCALGREVLLYETGSVKIFYTDDGKAVGICSGGYCVVRTPEEWLNFAWPDRRRDFPQPLPELPHD